MRKRSSGETCLLAADFLAAPLGAALLRAAPFFALPCRAAFFGAAALCGAAALLPPVAGLPRAVAPADDGDYQPVRELARSAAAERFAPGAPEMPLMYD